MIGRPDESGYSFLIQFWEKLVKTNYLEVDVFQTHHL